MAGITSALIAGGVGLAGAAMSNKSARKAASAQTQAADRASQIQRQNFLDMMNMIRPQIQAGDAARTQMMSELGLSMPAAAAGQAPGQVPGQFAGLANTYPGLFGNAFSGATAQRRGFGGPGDWSIAPGEVPTDPIGNMAPGQRPSKQSTYANREGSKLPVQDTDVPAATSTASDPYARFRATPGYQFQLTEGQRAIDSSAAARGGLMRGTTLQRLSQFGQGLADQTYGQYWNRLAALAGMGQTATSGAVGLGSSTASNLGNLAMQAGDARASSYLTQGATNVGALGNIGGIIGGMIGKGGF